MNSYYMPLVKYLKNLNIDQRIIEEIAVLFSLKNYDKDSYFAVDSGDGDKIGFVLSGLFYMSTENSDGSLLVKEFLNENQFLLASFDPDQKNSVNIISLRNSVILEAKYSDILKYFAKYPELLALSKKRIENEFESACDKLNQFANASSMQRYMIFREKYGRLEEDIPQYIVAAYIGVTPTHLSRLKSDLKYQHM